MIFQISHILFDSYLFASSRDAKYCNERVCLSVCLSARISKTTCPSFTKFSAHFTRDRDDDNAISYVLPVLWLTSCLLIVGTSQNHASNDFGSSLVTTAASQGLAAGSFLADRAEASPAHHSAEPGPTMRASMHCKYPDVCPFWHGALSADGGWFGTETRSSYGERPTRVDSPAVSTSVDRQPAGVLPTREQTNRTDRLSIF